MADPVIDPVTVAELAEPLGQPATGWPDLGLTTTLGSVRNGCDGYPRDIATEPAGPGDIARQGPDSATTDPPIRVNESLPEPLLRAALSPERGQVRLRDVRFVSRPVAFVGGGTVQEP